MLLLPLTASLKYDYTIVFMVVQTLIIDQVG